MNMKKLLYFYFFIRLVSWLTISIQYKNRKTASKVQFSRRLLIYFF